MKELAKHIPDTPETRHEAVVQRQILELGTAVRAARLAHGWSQAELAQQSKVSQADISRIENGVIVQRGPTAVTLCRLAGALGMRVALEPAEVSVPAVADDLEWIVRRAVHTEFELLQIPGVLRNPAGKGE